MFWLGWCSEDQNEMSELIVGQRAVGFGFWVARCGISAVMCGLWFVGYAL